MSVLDCTTNLTWQQIILAAARIDENGNISLATSSNSTPAPTNPKVYRALLTQEGENIPIAIELENTLGNITFTRVATGNYTIESNGLFTLLKTMIFCGPQVANAPTMNSISVDSITDSIISISTTKIVSESADDYLLNNTSIEILVYE